MARDEHIAGIELVPMPGASPTALAGEIGALAAGALADVGESVVLLGDSEPTSPIIAELERRGLPYRAHGAALFSGHPSVRQLLLGLGAIADRNDGVGEAGILRAPFFAIDEEDVIVALTHKDDTDVRRRRVSTARDLLGDLRRRRHRHTPAELARALFERSAVYDALAGLPNGAQELAALEAAVSWVEALAWREDLDFDSLALRLRGLLRSPAEIDLPLERSPGVVQIVPMTLAVQIECEEAILGASGFDATLAQGWSCLPAGKAILVSAAPLPAQVLVRHRVVVAIADDPDSARATGERLWPAVRNVRVRGSAGEKSMDGV